MEKPGNPNSRKNLQLLCPNCHRHKTAEDRKKIAQYKQKHGIKTIKKSRKTNARKKPKRQDSLGLGGFGLPKQSKRRRGEFDFGF